MDKQQSEYLGRQTDERIAQAGQQAALESASRQSERTVHNQQFLAELRDADLDSETYQWLQEEYPDWFSGAKSVTNRGDEWDLNADLIMQNKRERAVAENRPGRLLRDRPFLHATMKGADTPQPDAYQSSEIPGDVQHWEHVVAAKNQTQDPITSQEFSRIYGAAEVAADLMTLSRNGAGLESVSTVKTETTTRRESEEEETASRLGKVLE